MTRSRLLGLSLGVVLASAALVTSSLPAAADDVAAADTYTVTGYGYGHGHGLSQYGAQGAAKQGVPWQQILGFYYPGTSLGRAGGTISVLISADKKDVVVDARDGLRLTRLTGPKTFTLGRLRPKATTWRIMPRGSRSVVSYRAPGRGGWQKWTAFPGEAELSAGGQPLTLRLPNHRTADYRGVLRSVEKHTVNVLPLDRYVQGVVPSEVPTSWPADAVRAQAVAARTYAAFERETATGYYDICDTASCQVYGGAGAEDPAATAAVKATRRAVVVYEGQPAFTQFSSSNGGYSAAGSEPYLVAQPDPYEVSSDNPNDPWTTTVTRAQIEKAWPGIGSLKNISFTRDGLGTPYGGRVVSLRLTGSLGGLPTAVDVTGDEFRIRLALKSTWLQLTPTT
jgi:SpoIID/LytB domain protein